MDNKIQQPLSHTLLKNRLTFVQQKADDFFAANALPVMQAQAFDNGKESLVFDCNNGYVLKIKTGKPFQEVKLSTALQPVETGYSQEFDISYDIFQKAKLKDVSFAKIFAFSIKTLFAGGLIHDPAKVNFGFIYDEHKKNEKMVLIDYGAARHVKNLFSDSIIAMGYVAKKILFYNIPVARGHYYEIKNNVRAMFNGKGTETSQPQADMAVSSQKSSLNKSLNHGPL